MTCSMTLSTNTAYHIHLKIIKCACSGVRKRPAHNSLRKQLLIINKKAFPIIEFKLKYLNQAEVFCNCRACGHGELSGGFITHPAMHSSSARVNPEQVLESKVIWKHHIYQNIKVKGNIKVRSNKTYLSDKKEGENAYQNIFMPSSARIMHQVSKCMKIYWWQANLEVLYPGCEWRWSSGSSIWSKYLRHWNEFCVISLKCTEVADLDKINNKMVLPAAASDVIIICHINIKHQLLL